jgi:hypothetical protein
MFSSSASQRGRWRSRGAATGDRRHLWNDTIISDEARSVSGRGMKMPDQAVLRTIFPVADSLVENVQKNTIFGA